MRRDVVLAGAAGHVCDIQVLVSSSGMGPAVARAELVLNWTE